MRPRGTNRRQRTAGGLIAVLVAAVLLLGGCGPGDRELAERPPLADRHAIDLCALAPTDQVRADVDEAIGRGWMRRTLGACWFTSPGGSLWMELAAEDLPDQVAEADPEVPVEDVDGGQILDTTHPSADCLERTLVSDAGYIIELHASVSGDDVFCDILDDLGALVLGNLAAEVPTIDWPDGTSGTVDLCAAVEEHGIADALGLEDEVQAQTGNHFDCTVGGQWELGVSFDTRVSLPEDTHPTSIEVGGQPALATDGGCALSIDLGENPVLTERLEEGRDTLDVSAEPREIDCEAVPGALEELVRSLAH